MEHAAILSKKTLVWICFIVSTLISIGIIWHGYYFAFEEFPNIPFLAGTFILLTEIGVVVLPYITALSTKDWRDKALMFILFTMSILPATIHTAGMSIKNQKETLTITRPIEPSRPVVIGTLNKELERIDSNIKSNNSMITNITNKSIDKPQAIAYRTREYSASNKKLQARSETVLKDINALEEKYALDLDKYRSDLVEYNSNNKSAIIGLVDVLKIWYAFILIVGSQLVNLRFSYHGSKLLNEIKPEVSKKEEADPEMEFIKDCFKNQPPERWVVPDESFVNEIKKDVHPNEFLYTKEDLDTVGKEPETISQEEVNELIDEIVGTEPFDLDYMPEEEKTDGHFNQEKVDQLLGIIPIEKDTTDSKIEKEESIDFISVTPKQYIKKFSSKDLSDKTIDKFIDIFRVNDLSRLNKLINSANTKEYIIRQFPVDTANKLIKTLEKIKDR